MTLLGVIIHLSIFGISHVVAGLPGPRTLLGRAPNSIIKAIASAPTASTSTRVSNGFQNSTLRKSHSQSQLDLVTASPTSINHTQTYQYKGLGSCTLGVSSCSNAGVDLSQYGPAMEELPNECLLWDNTCSGNQTLALKQFFGDSIHNLTENLCFMNSTVCEYHPPGQADAFDKIRNWMRSPQCVSSANKYGKLFDAGTTSLLGAYSLELLGSCCRQCRLNTENVNIYYWPEPDANTSCLSIVGDAVNPLGLGATTQPGPGMTYWGCTPKTPLTIYNAQLAIGGPPGAAEIVQSIITTAKVVTYGGIKFKQWVVNPWSSQGCGYNDSIFKNLSRRGEPEPLRARGHSLVVPSITQQNGLPVSTVVSGEFTFTSPSIYANFIGVSAGDFCGETTVSSIMLSFTSGELSTIAGPVQSSGAPPSARAFDFRDLPCPPQSIMEENWYKPELGEPYRPFIAMPSKLKDVLWFSNCEADFFTAYDPPKTLVPAAAMNPTITTNAGDPQAETQAPVPGSIQQEPGASKTASYPIPTVTPTQDPPNSQPKASKDPMAIVPDPKLTVTPAQDPPNSQPKVSSDPVALVPDLKSAATPVQAPQNSRLDGANDQGSIVVKGGSGAGADPNVSATMAQDPTQTQNPGGSAKDPGVGAGPAKSNQSKQTNNAVSAFDPSNVKPDQMSGIEGALASSHTAASPSQPQSQGVVLVVGSPDHPQTQEAAPAAAPAQSQGLGVIVASAMGAAPATSEQPNSFPGHSPPSADSGTIIINKPQARPSEALMPSANDGQIVALSGVHVGVIGTQVINAPVPIPASQTAMVDSVVFQVLNNGVPTNGRLVDPSEAAQVTAAVESAIQSGLASGVTTVNKEIINSIAHNILTGTTPSPQAAPIPLGSSAIVIEGASSVDLGPFVTTVAGKPITGDLTAVQSAKYTLAAGAPGVTIDGTALSLATAGQLVEDSKTIAVGGPSVGLGGLIMGGLGPLVTTIDNQVVTANPTAVEIAGFTLKPGAPGVTVGGTAVSFDTAGELVVGSKTAALKGESGVVDVVATLVGGAVISAGGSPATVDGTVVAIPSDDSGLVVNGKTVPLPTAAPASVFSVAGQAFTAAPSGFAIGSQTLSPGGLPITLSGTPISLGSSELQIGTSMISILSAAPASILTVGGQVLTAAAGGFAIGSQTLSPGGSSVTISGTVVSLGSLGLQIGTSTIPLTPAAPKAVFTVGGQAFTAAPSGFAIGSQSLTPGRSAITLSGTVISLGSSGLQIGTSTVPLQASGTNMTAAPSSTSRGGTTIAASSGTSTSAHAGVSSHTKAVHVWNLGAIVMAVIILFMYI